MHKLAYFCIDYSNSLTCLCFLHTMNVVIRFMRDGSTAVHGDWVAPSRFFNCLLKTPLCWLDKAVKQTFFTASSEKDDTQYR